MRCVAAGLAAVSSLLAQQPEAAELLEALGRTAAFFSRTSPSLGARELLAQRARRANMQILRRGRNDELKDVAFTLPESFELHEVVSGYRMGVLKTGGFHEIRDIRAVDGMAPDRTAIRHALSIGADSVDDESKKRLLEELELERLQGAATDFGPLLLLFSAPRQRDAKFTVLGHKATEDGGVWILNYRQTTGEGNLTEFRNSRETRHLPEGQIWFRDDNLVPVRITMNTEEILTPKFSLRNEAEIDYQPTPYGLAPRSVVHRQFLNRELLVENRFSYSDFYGIEIIP